MDGPGASASLQDSANLVYLHPAFLGASGGLKPVARDPGAARAQEVAAGRPLLAGKELPDRATGPRLAAMFRVPSLECARAYWVPGRPALSRPARRGYEGIKIK